MMESFASPLPSLYLDGGLVQGWSLRHTEVFLAADRPDRLEVAFDLGAARLEHARREFLAWPDRVLSARWRGEPIFSGVVDQARCREDAVDGRSATIVAYAGFHRLRRARPREVYCEMTDAEVAARIAAELGLVPRVEPTRRVHRRLVREGDPLTFLRERARAAGFQLAVTGGRLLFGRALPDAGGTAVLRPRRGAQELELRALQLHTHAGFRGLGGAVDLPGDWGWKPLVRVAVEGLDGHLRVARALHRLDGVGYRTRLELLEDGLDLAAAAELRGPVEPE